ncbi:peroxisomal sarcosine oxidase-like isoform X3 [Patiria miniata]|uniref:FAD dependent oxidoreductase domain-containing protein n=1 Tax=Patiria miniata TaxID=46514 RepID=A0A914BF70_PATMI|nr:peroxisomal sarcosine oxidase-like isoform X3 [Patiria miniata]
MAQHDYDCVVVGAGVEGSATGYHLTRTGHKTLLLEQFTLGHSKGSSHGQSRITRYTYRQIHYANMMPECFQTWERLGREVGTELYRKTGLLAVNGPPHQDYTLRSESLRVMGKPCELPTVGEICQRHPGFSFGPEHKAFVDPNGGVLRADSCLHALQTMFLKQGGVVKENEEVLEIVPGDPVLIVTSKGRYTAKSVVLTPGAWASKMLRPLGIDPPLKVTQLKVCYCPERQPGAFGNYPCFYYLSEKYETCGLPCDDHSGLFKVYNDHGDELQGPDQQNQAQHSHQIETLMSFIREHVPGLIPEPSLVEKCLYTSTPDKDIILDMHPDHPNIVIGCGFSGHGFKLAPAVGRILSELATGTTPSYDISPMSLKRFPNNGRLAAKV